MRKLLFLTCALALLNCGTDPKLARASKIQIQSFLKTDKDYGLFLEAHLNNLKGISLLNESHLKQAEVLVTKVLLKEDVLENVKKIYDLTNLNPNTVFYFSNFITRLNKLYLYDEKDLIEVIRLDIESKVSNAPANGRTSWLWVFIDPCGIYCGAQAANYRAGLIYNGVDAQLATAAGNAYYLGCVNGCNNPQNIEDGDGGK